MAETTIAANLFTVQKLGTDNLEASRKKNLFFESFLIDAFKNNQIENRARERQIVEELNEIREEVEETCAVTNDVYPVPESAYDETTSLLDQMPRNIPVPEMMWLERGGIGLQWRPENSIVTMSLYGDNHVNYVAILGKQYEIAVTCPLSDQLLLPGFLETLSTLFQKRT